MIASSTAIVISIDLHSLTCLDFHFVTGKVTAFQTMNLSLKHLGKEWPTLKGIGIESKSASAIDWDFVFQKKTETAFRSQMLTRIR